MPSASTGCLIVSAVPSVVCRSILGRWLPGSRGAATSSPLRGIALLLCGIGPGPGCAGRDWRAAKGAHTGAAYRAFVTANPEHYKVPEAMGRAGRRAVEERFNWDAEARKLVALYADLLTRRH